jgi:hypothetical protein
MSKHELPGIAYTRSFYTGLTSAKGLNLLNPDLYNEKQIIKL